jgi:hypothetical protein
MNLLGLFLYSRVEQKAGAYMDTWKELLDQDPEAAEMAVEPKAGAKRKAVSTRGMVLPQQIELCHFRRLSMNL